MFVAEGEDYVFVSSTTVTFQSGNTSNGTTQCVQIQVIDDDAYEENEVFIVRIASIMPASVARNGSLFEATYTIQDNTGRMLFDSWA